MLRIVMATAVALVIGGAALAQSKGPNGGVVVRVEDHPIEFVLREQEIVFYIGDHDGKPMPTKGMKARAVVQDGGKTTTVTLAPAPPNMFVGKLASPLSAKARIAFSGTIEGHSLTARFVAP